MKLASYFKRKKMPSYDAPSDEETSLSLGVLESAQSIAKNRFNDVKSVLVVLSSRGMAFDRDALRQKILTAYPEASTFFLATGGEPLGVEPPRNVDLVIDFTGPGQRQGFRFAKKIRKIARHCVGRNVGWFRKKIYDRVFDEGRVFSEPATGKVTAEFREPAIRELFVQRQVLALAGIAAIPAAQAGPDLGKKIALDLPPLAR